MSGSAEPAATTGAAAPLRTVTVPARKYAVVEQERRWLVATVPDGDVETVEIHDRYLVGTRLRLREVVSDDGVRVRKLGHKVRLGDGPREIACTSVYLDDAEWDVLAALPATTLSKTRHRVRRDGLLVVVDRHEDGTLVAELDDRDDAPAPVPDWLEVLREVTDDEAWTGGALAR